MEKLDDINKLKVKLFREQIVPTFEKLKRENNNNFDIGISKNLIRVKYNHHFYYYQYNFTYTKKESICFLT